MFCASTHGFAVKNLNHRETWPIFGTADENDLYYFGRMTTISLKLPDQLLERLESAARARGTTKLGWIVERPAT